MIPIVILIQRLYDKIRSLVTWPRQHWLFKGFLRENNDLVHPPPEYISTTAISTTSHNKPNKSPFAQIRIWLIELKGDRTLQRRVCLHLFFPIFSPYTEISCPLIPQAPGCSPATAVSQSVSQDKHGRQGWRKRLGISALKFA